MAKIGVIGGSGVYALEGIEKLDAVAVKTPYGEPSDELVICKLAGKEIVFLPRHGRGHQISPSMINYRANIYAMKKLGVTKLISVSACGSLKDELKPLDFVVPTQFVDRTNQARKYTFFDEGMVAHITFAHPVCEKMAKIVYSAGEGLEAKVHYGGTYLNMEGPQFSTLAESRLYRSWGMDIIGMTNMAEARLAREAEMCFTSLAAVTDYDCWHPEHASVTIDVILNNLKQNVTRSKTILKKILSALDAEEPCGCGEALKCAIVTRPEFIPQSVKEKLDIIIGKYIK